MAKELTDDDRRKMLFAEETLLNGSRKTKIVNIDCEDLGYPDCVGKFKFHYPSLVERIQIGTDQAQMLQGLPRESIDIQTNNIAYASSILMHVIDYCPDWFKLNQIGDSEILYKVFNAYSEWVDSFRQPDKRNNTGKTGKKSTAKKVHVGDEKVEGTTD